MTPTADPALTRLYLFGDLEIHRGAQLVRLPTRKAELLLAYLVLRPEAHGREKLAALFWGDVSDEQARGSLRKALTALRQAFGPDVLLADRLTIQLNPDYPLWNDAAEFDRPEFRRPAGHEGVPPDRERLAALDLYRGDLLAGFYDDWIAPLREYYHAAFLERALSLAQLYRTRSEYDRAIDLARRALDVDQANERAHQQLMFCYLASGRRSEALQQYDLCRRLLQEELGVSPGPETTALYRWILSGPASPSVEALRTNLPIPLSSFIGREAETARVKSLLRPLSTTDPSAGRLVTLTGPGGSGKTRLAIHAATDLLDAFPDGVWWIELAPLNDGAHVTKAVAHTLGVRESPDEPLLATLSAFLSHRQALLVLDNCEHLVAACADLVAALLSRCPDLKVMATSRQPLGLAGEFNLPVPPLAVPRYPRWMLSDSLLNFEGIRLFVQRAGEIDPGFVLDHHNAQAVTQICARLDGIPLAIELAAMRVRSLSAAEIAARLDERFDLLAAGSRAAPSRHQTLRNALDWSYNLLSAPEQGLLRRLSVFAGGWFAEGAQHLYLDEPGSSSGSRPSPALLELLGRLVDNSLVIAETASGRTRYQMLETIREYAREKLAGTGQTETIRDRHTRLFVELAEAGERGLRGPEQGHWLETLDRELDNLRAALDWSLVHDLQTGYRLAGALTWYWNLRGHWREGPAWVAKLLAAPQGAAPDALRARALVAAGHLAYWGSNDFPAARAWLEEAIALYRRSAVDSWPLADALALYGELLNEIGEAAAARPVLEECLLIAQRLGDDGRWLSAWAWLSLGGLPDQPPVRQAHMERSVALFREIGDEAQLPVALARLAWCHLGQKEYAAAERCAQKGLILTERIGDAMGAAWFLKLDGDRAGAQGDYHRAEAAYQAAHERFSALGSKNGRAEALVSLGQVAVRTGDVERARALWREALTLYTEIGQQKAGQWVTELLAGLSPEPSATAIP
jgi:non-specific serine/threonine protein kinase